MNGYKLAMVNTTCPDLLFEIMSHDHKLCLAIMFYFKQTTR